MNPLFRSVALIFSALFLQAALCFGASPAGNLTARERGKIFLDGIAESVDVPWLERVASSLVEAEKAIPPNTLLVGILDLRIAAFARLGELHTKESLAAVERIEKKAKECGLVPEVVPLDVWRIPVFNYMAPEIKPIATIKAPDGTTYGVITNPFLMGGNDFFLISTKTPDDKSSWSRPKLIPYDNAPVGISEPSLVFKSDGVLELTVAAPKYSQLYEGETIQLPVKRKLEFSIQDVLRDRDGDGWTDIEELRLGLDPRKKDTDGDGLDDGMDPCANFAPPAGHENDEESQILKKALFAEFGLTQSRFLLLVNPQSAKVQVWGYPGPVIYLDDPYQWRKQHKNGGIFVDWTVSRSGDEAQVPISYHTPTGSIKQEIHLRKIEGKWIVVKRLEKGGQFIQPVPED
jgi:hypothetical protein